MVHDLPGKSKTSTPAFDNATPTRRDARLTQVNGLVKVQELRENAVEIHNIILIRPAHKESRESIRKTQKRQKKVR